MSNIGKQRLLFVLAAVLLIAGCRNEPPRPEPPPDGPSPFPELGIACSNYPAVDGSTSTQPLGIFVACKILDAAYTWVRNSGSQELMQKLVMKDLQMPPVPDMMVGTSMAAPFTMLDNDPHGVGYTVYFYHEHMAPEASVKDCAIDGVMPGPKTIRDGEYPLVTEVYVAIRTNLPGDAPARRLRDWLLSPAGQAIVEECGYVPIGQTAPPVELPGRTDVPDRPDE